MQLRFTNYKKIYIILGVFVFLLGTLYFVSVIYKRNKGNSENIVSENNTKNIVQTATVEQLLTEKTDLIVNSLAIGSLGYRQDPVFQNASELLVSKISSEVKKYQTPINIETVQVRIDPNGLYGRTYIRIIGNNNLTSDLIEIAYQKNDKGEWNLASFIIHTPL